MQTQDSINTLSFAMVYNNNFLNRRVLGNTLWDDTCIGKYINQWIDFDISLMI